jgi:hypothetical protein
MGKCVYCGRVAGWFSSFHKECKSAHDLQLSRAPASGAPGSNMPSSPGQSDQCWSLAHLLLLSKFLMARRADSVSTGYWTDNWKAALGESKEVALRRFVTAGLLTPCPLPERLANYFSAAQLKQMLRDRQLKSSGRKDQMADRLCNADAAGMEKAVGGIVLLRCSETGQQIANQFAPRQEEMRRKALEALGKRNLDLAISVVSLFNDELGFPSDPTFGTCPATLREQLRRTFTTTPKILSRVNKTVLEHCRIAVGMDFLGVGSEWLPEDPETELQMENMKLDVEGMIVSSVQSGLNLDEWRRSGLVRSLKIVGSSDGDSCPACNAAQKRVWAIRSVPELPLRDCTSESGCRCSYVLHEIRAR